MANHKTPKIHRQLWLYDTLSTIDTGAVYGPDDLMKRFHIGRRMLQRDLKDLRDCGLINVKYNKPKDRYYIADDIPFDESIPTRRKEHLKRLYRLGTLIGNLSQTDSEALRSYEFELEEYEDFITEAKASGNKEELKELLESRQYYIRHKPVLYDLKSEYYALFPDKSERTRQRDFKELSRAGYGIYYSPKYKTFIFETENE